MWCGTSHQLWVACGIVVGCLVNWALWANWAAASPIMVVELFGQIGQQHHQSLLLDGLGGLGGPCLSSGIPNVQRMHSVGQPYQRSENALSWAAWGAPPTLNLPNSMFTTPCSMIYWALYFDRERERGGRIRENPDGTGYTKQRVGEASSTHT